MNFEHKCTHILVDLDNIQQRVAVDCSHGQNRTVVTECHSNKQYSTVKKLNFIYLNDNQFWFNFCHRFQTPVQNFDLGQFEFEFKLKIANFQYHNYIRQRLARDKQNCQFYCVVGDKEKGFITFKVRDHHFSTFSSIAVVPHDPLFHDHSF
jgi:hypothetical protein